MSEQKNTQPVEPAAVKTVFVETLREDRRKPYRDNKGKIVPGGVHFVVDADAPVRLYRAKCGTAAEVTPNANNTLPMAIIADMGRNRWYKVSPAKKEAKAEK